MKDYHWKKYPGNIPSELEDELQHFNSKSKTVFHSTNWLKMFSSELVYFICRNQEGVLQGYFIGALTKKYSVTGFHIPPFTHCFSPVFSDSLKETVKQELYSGLCLLLEEYGVVDLKFQRGCFDPLPFHWAGYQNHILVTYILEGNYETYWNTLNKNRVREIKKIKTLVDNGTLKIDSDISLSDFLRLYEETAKRGGFEYKTGELVSLYNNLNAVEHKLIVLHGENNEPLAFGYFPFDDTAVYNVINASVRVVDPVLKTSNLYIINEIIRFALETGRVFDFEGSLLPGVASFYRMLGGKQVTLYRSTKSRSLFHSLLRAMNQMKKDRTNLTKVSSSSSK